MSEPPTAPTARRRFWPIVLLGAGAAALAAAGASRSWLEVSGPGGTTATGRPMPGAEALVPPTTGNDLLPLAGATALVALVCWGVVLVLRSSRARRVVLGLGTLAATAGAVQLALVLVRGGLVDVLRRSDPELLAGAAAPGRTAWPYATLVGLLLALAAGATGLRDAPRWPSMARRYDAPAAPPAPGDAASLGDRRRDVWRALDEGLDPTDEAPGGSPDPSGDHGRS